ncbi:hypothetical protein T484DRAFT_1967446 [Baffinella frigidus]|nr:hypothetical protein T484DRAFT_1967444 [Cryptophyta sp. CCMP2293]KAJ1475770.1 hypothetical protein T484DRAFT_1967446 [Cryptophyta sp. CCMP2293]
MTHPALVIVASSLWSLLRGWGHDSLRHAIQHRYKFPRDPSPPHPEDSPRHPRVSASPPATRSESDRSSYQT